MELGPTPRFIGCQRGALGTKAAAHEQGAAVKGLLTMWGYFLVDPDSTLADELTTNFATVFNRCDFDMVYFDASDGISDAYLDRWYYLNKLHLGYYRKFKKDVLYQTSNGTGSDLVWHIVPRSASADGHGDLKKYLDERLLARRDAAQPAGRRLLRRADVAAGREPDHILRRRNRRVSRGHECAAVSDVAHAVNCATVRPFTMKIRLEAVEFHGKMRQ